MKIVALIILIVGVLSVIACTGDQPAPTPTSAPSPDIDATVAAGIHATQEAEEFIDATV